MQERICVIVPFLQCSATDRRRPAGRNRQEQPVQGMGYGSPVLLPSTCAASLSSGPGHLPVSEREEWAWIVTEFLTPQINTF